MQLSDEWDVRNFMYCPNYFAFASEMPELNVKKMIQEDLWKYLKQAEPLFLSNPAVDKNKIYEFIAGLDITRISNLPPGYKRYADVMTVILYSIISKFADGYNDDYEVGIPVKGTFEYLDNTEIKVWTDLVLARTDKTLIFIKCFPFHDNTRIERRFAQLTPLALDEYYKSIYDVSTTTYMVYAFKNAIFQRKYYGDRSHKAFTGYIHRYGKLIKDLDPNKRETKLRTCSTWCPFNNYCHGKYTSQMFTYEEERQIRKDHISMSTADLLGKWKCARKTLFNIINRHKGGNNE